MIEIITPENLPVKWDDDGVQKEITQEITTETAGSNNKTQKAVQILAKRISRNSSFKYAVLFPRRKDVLMYNTHKNHYDLEEMKILNEYVSLLILDIIDGLKLPRSVIDSVSVRLKQEHYRKSLSFWNEPLDCIPYNNGNYFVDTGEFLPVPDYTTFVTYRLFYNYVTEGECPIFDRYIYDLAEGHSDRVDLLMGFLYSVLHSLTELQSWMHIYGQGGGGKSIFIHLCTLLVGEEVTAPSKVNALNKDKFETQHVKDMKLVPCSETKDWESDLETIKGLTGGDKLPSREKHSNLKEEFVFGGKILITGNHKMHVRDSGGAIERRHLFLQVKVGNKGSVALLEKSSRTGKWGGTMLKELPQIANKIRNMDRVKVMENIKNFPESCPSQKAEWEYLMESFDPMSAFIKEALVPGEGSFIGAKMKNTPGARLEARSRNTIYPAYAEWCSRRSEIPLGVRKFSESLDDALTRNGRVGWVKRVQEGQKLMQLELRQGFWDKDQEFGAPTVVATSAPTPPPLPDKLIPLASETLEDRYTNLDGTPKVCIAKLNDHDKTILTQWSLDRHPCLDELLYEKYMSHFQSTEFKEMMNKLGKIIAHDPNFGTQSLVPFELVSPIASNDYKDRVKEVIEKNIENLKSFSFCPYTYKLMGSSPRICPQIRKFSPNSVKRHVRTTLYSRLGDVLDRELGYTILDLDLASCYSAIVRGLYPSYLPHVNLALANKGLWNGIKQDFIEKGLESSFHKDAVKVCVYSSFFTGGRAAMRKGIVQKFIDLAGITRSEFDASRYSQDVDSFAQVIVNNMQNSKYIEEFRNISEMVQNESIGTELVGPTGYRKLVTKNHFGEDYSDYLQSYEFALVSQTMVTVGDEFPDLEYLAHFHDGLTVAIPSNQCESLIERVNVILETLRGKLGLETKQSFEIKDKFHKILNNNYSLSQSTIKVLKAYKKKNNIQ